MTDPLTTLLRAARDARYALMARKRHGAAGDWLLDHAAEKLTKALQDFPNRPRREAERFNAGLGSYLDTVEEFSQ